MINPSFFSGHSFARLWALSLLIVGSAAIGATNIYFGIDHKVSSNLNNPHRIPDHMDPKSPELSAEIKAIKVDIREEFTEPNETMHSVAFKDHHGSSEQFLDFTTGTSN